jgi:hypothetical protein
MPVDNAGLLSLAVCIFQLFQSDVGVGDLLSSALRLPS